jgi:anaerobic ribonucleoside-triphosphate reductase activating protein
VAPSFLPRIEGTEMDGDDIVRRIVREPTCEGITVSGGEPLWQAEALAPVLAAVRATGRSVIVYTGFELDEIVRLGQRDPALLRVCASADVLIDHPYDHALNDSRGLRGSTNQVVHFLTPRYAHLRELFERGERRRERHELADGILLAGVPPLDGWRRSALDPTGKAWLDDARDL